MTREEYERLIEHARVEYRENLVAIQRTWELSQQLAGADNQNAKDEPSAPPQKQQSTENQGDREQFGRGDVLRMIKEVLAQQTGTYTFSIINMQSALEQRHPNQSFIRASLAGALRRLTEDGEIVVEQLGAGRRPTIYRRISTNQEGKA
jgi:hypothetical protein